MKPLADQRGSALVIVILIMLVIFISGTAFVTLAASERKVSIYHMAETQAYYLADAGINIFLARLYDTEAETGFGYDMDGDSLDDITVSVQDNGRELEVTSLGQVNLPDGSVKATKNIEAVLEKNLLADPVFIIGSGGAGGGGDSGGGEDLPTLIISSNSTINGNVVINGNINIKSSSTVINGDLIAGAGGTIEVHQNAEVTGVQIQNDEVLGSEFFVKQLIDDWMAKADRFLVGDTVFDQELLDTMQDEVVYVDGDATFSDNSKLLSYSGVIVVNGSITIEDDIEPVDGSLTIISTGDINVVKRAESLTGVFITQSGFNANGSLTLTGCLIAESITQNEIKGNITLTFDESIIQSSEFPQLTEKYKLTDWKETTPAY